MKTGYPAIIEILLRISQVLLVGCMLSVLLTVGWIVYAIANGSHLPTVLWCAESIISPLQLLGNILLPLALGLHVLVFGLCLIRHDAVKLIWFVSLVPFIALTICTLVFGWQYCHGNLEGKCLWQFFWWSQHNQ